MIQRTSQWRGPASSRDGRHGTQLARRSTRRPPLGIESLEERTLLDCSAFPPAHLDNPLLRAEHEAIMKLVPCEAVTHQAIASGDWDNPATWDHGIPDVNANVLIPPGTEVLIDAVLKDPVRTVRVDGSLAFATNIVTALAVDTIVVTPQGTLTVGTPESPVAPGVKAQILITDSGPIDTAWDPFRFSRGLVSHGAVTMQGADKTPFVNLAVGAAKRSSVLVLAETPVGWQAGDQIVVSGVNSNAKQDETFKIRSIMGNTLTIDGRFRSPHISPSADLHPFVANLTRNIVIASQNTTDVDRRGHVMFMHSAETQVANAAFIELGRTDKLRPLNNARVDDQGVLVPGTGSNQVGRYSVHFHRSGTDPHGGPAVLQGSVIVGSPGWGVVNHSSNVTVEDNIVYNVVGAGFVTEAGDEIGSFRHNAAIRSLGSRNGLRSRVPVQDFGHQGDGFWFQGPGVEVQDNIAVGQAHAGFVYFSRALSIDGHPVEFPAQNLRDPAIAGGRSFVSVQEVPIPLFENNTVFASTRGLELWYHLNEADHTVPSVIDGLTTWNTQETPVFLGYSNQVHFVDAQLLGNLAAPSGTAMDLNEGTRNIVYDNVRAEGFQSGIVLPRSGHNEIIGGSFNNVNNLVAETAGKSGRQIILLGNPEFGTLGAAALNGQVQCQVCLKADFDPKDQDLSKVFNPDMILDARTANAQLYYLEQRADFVPFPAGQSAAYVPAELLGKTNQQLFDQYGLAVGGAIAPSDARTAPAIRGLIGTPANYLPKLDLISERFTTQLTGYQLIYRNQQGGRIVDSQLENLRPGWNVITRLIDGHNRTFLIFGTA